MKALLLTMLLAPVAGHADPAVIEGAKAVRRADGWVVSVTLRHADTGWEDYADGWRVELEDGTVLATRPLSHPHVTEQPFTRSRTGISIPQDVRKVVIRASTLPSGWDSAPMVLDLPR